MTSSKSPSNKSSNKTKADLCFLCDKAPKGHHCPETICKAFNTSLSVSDGRPKLREIENLVFQGAGVKAFAYAGVLDQIQKTKTDIFKNLKRAAGVSFGALFALYVSLNVDPKDIYNKLWEKDLFEYLDDGITLQVHPSTTISGSKKGTIGYSVKEIAKKLYENWNDNFLESFFVKAFPEYFEQFANLDNATHTILKNFLAKEEVKNTIRKVLEAFSDKKFDKFLQSFQDARAEKKEDGSYFSKGFEYSKGLWNKVVSIFSTPDKVELKDEMLANAFAELCLYILNLQKGSNKDKNGFGLFTGEKLNETLVKDIIKEQITKHNKKEKAESLGIDIHNPTFKELVDLGFKDLFVIAFNVNTARTQLFSPEDTPNVYVADAIWASMSVPFLFKPRRVQEKGNPEGFKTKGKKQSHDNETHMYMDGSILDNYPIWAFDDIKYCIPQNLEQLTGVKVNNPRTLGFKLVDSERVRSYANRLKGVDMEIEVDKKYLGVFADIGRLLLSATVDEHEESNFQSQGLIRRTCFISNADVSTFQIVKPNEKDQLFKNGSAAVESYLRRDQ